VTRRSALARVLLLAIVLLVATAGPASADPAKPGDYTSGVTHVDPPTSAVSVKVVGGDGFLELTVARGHDVIVDGYSGGPWLHVRPDGTVEENQNSPATYQNATRFGAPVPPNITADTETKEPPVYKTVATGGVYAWHDHRIHWMSPQPPPNVTRGDLVYPDWTVPMIVDGAAVTVHGRLVYVKAISPIPWFALAIVALVAVVVVGRGTSTLVASVAIALASVAALFVGIVAYRSIPSVAGPNPLEIVLPAVATVAGVFAVVTHRRAIGVIGILAAVAAVSGWAIMRFSVLLKPVLPTTLAFAIDRGVTAIVLGTSVAAAVLAVRSGALVLRLPELDFGDDEAGAHQPG
jgi:hypothetical protein